MRKNELMYSRFHTLQVRTKNCKHDFWSCYIAWCAPPPSPLCTTIRPTVPTHLHPWRGSPAAPLLSLRPLEATRSRWQGGRQQNPHVFSSIENYVRTRTVLLEDFLSFFIILSLHLTAERRKSEKSRCSRPPVESLRKRSCQRSISICYSSTFHHHTVAISVRT
jgi:hypothetical protein